MKYYSLPLFFLLLVLGSCGKSKKTDASGNFESDEVIVSAEQTGRLLAFPIHEGDKISRGSVVGSIDVTAVQLQKDQVEASIQALQEKTTDPRPRVELVRKQLAVQQAQLEQQQNEKTRTEHLIKADAATQKQLDDINALIDQLKKQIAVSEQQIALDQSTISTQNRSVFSEKKPLEKSVAQIQEQISKGQIVNPVGGTVLTKYAMEGEVTSLGKPLYKIASLDTLTLRAYITGTQLAEIRLQQAVNVLVDNGSSAQKEYPGIIYWISDKAEFTPKTIQTRDERANLVYAIKIRVKNDGLLKIGMYAEVNFAQDHASAKKDQ
jgi:HlyD family secretion protein